MHDMVGIRAVSELKRYICFCKAATYSHFVALDPFPSSIDALLYFMGALICNPI